jgi:hypothetical protein
MYLHGYIERRAETIGKHAVETCNNTIPSLQIVRFSLVILLWIWSILVTIFCIF